VKIELEDIEGNTYTETIPKYPSAEIANKCEATFNAKVSATGSGEQTGTVENAYEAISQQKNIVVQWLNDNWFGNNLGPDRLSPPSQDKIMQQYSEYIEGVEVKKKGN